MPCLVGLITLLLWKAIRPLLKSHKAKVNMKTSFHVEATFFVGSAERQLMMPAYKFPFLFDTQHFSNLKHLLISEAICTMSQLWIFELFTF